MYIYVYCCYIDSRISQYKLYPTQHNPITMTIHITVNEQIFLQCLISYVFVLTQHAIGITKLNTTAHIPPSNDKILNKSLIK